MRANRLYGSEGGGADIRSPYPYQEERMQQISVPGQSCGKHHQTTRQRRNNSSTLRAKLPPS